MPEEKIEEILLNLESLLIKILKGVDEGRRTTIRRVGPLNDVRGVLVDLTIGIDPLESAAMHEFIQNSQRDHLIDVIEDDKSIKLVVQLPGVRKEDVSLESRENYIVLKIRRGEEVYCKEIPRGDMPCEMSIDSVVENNSVLEITFGKNDRANV